MRTGASFGVKLHGKALFARIFHSLATLIIGIYHSDCTDALEALVDYSIAMVLAGNVCSVVKKIFDRLIGTSVAVFELLRLCSHGKSRKLVTEANSEYGQATDELFDLFDAENIFGRISRAVGKHDSVRMTLENLLGGAVLREYGDRAAARAQAANDIALCAVID